MFEHLIAEIRGATSVLTSLGVLVMTVRTILSGRSLDRQQKVLRQLEATATDRETQLLEIIAAGEKARLILTPPPPGGYRRRATDNPPAADVPVTAPARRRNDKPKAAPDPAPVAPPRPKPFTAALVPHVADLRKLPTTRQPHPAPPPKPAGKPKPPAKPRTQK